MVDIGAILGGREEPPSLCIYIDAHTLMACLTDILAEHGLYVTDFDTMNLRIMLEVSFDVIGSDQAGSECCHKLYMNARL